MEIVKNFKLLLKTCFKTKKMVSQYADDLFVSSNYLNRIVKNITGLTARDHIQHQIISEAKRQAINTRQSMKEIAYWLGFDNIAHFSKFFKNVSGVNFRSFKRDQTS
jgi:AraC family transcriptional activator of pobA